MPAPDRDAAPLRGRRLDATQAVTAARHPGQGPRGGAAVRQTPFASSRSTRVAQ